MEQCQVNRMYVLPFELTEMHFDKVPLAGSV